MKNLASEVETSAALEARPSTLKTGLSIVAVTGSSYLRDELPEFKRTGVGNDRQSLKNFGR